MDDQEALENPRPRKTLEQLDLKDEPITYEPPPTVKRIRELSVEVTRLSGVAELWLAKDACEAIHSMERALNKLWAGQVSLSTYRDAVEAVDTARDLLHKAAVHDLKLAIAD